MGQRLQAAAAARSTSTQQAYPAYVVEYAVNQHAAAAAPAMMALLAVMMTWCVDQTCAIGQGGCH